MNFSSKFQEELFFNTQSIENSKKKHSKLIHLFLHKLNSIALSIGCAKGFINFLFVDSTFLLFLMWMEICLPVFEKCYNFFHLDNLLCMIVINWISWFFLSYIGCIFCILYNLWILLKGFFFEMINMKKIKQNSIYNLLVCFECNIMYFYMIKRFYWVYWIWMQYFIGINVQGAHFLFSNDMQKYNIKIEF